MAELLRELRCLSCRALLLKEYIHKGRLEIICNRCKTENRFTFRDLRAEAKQNKAVAKIKVAGNRHNSKDKR